MNRSESIWTKIRNLYNFLFNKPELKNGDKLAYPGLDGGVINYVEHLYYDWHNGIWFIRLMNKELSISHSLEIFYKDRINEQIIQKRESNKRQESIIPKARVKKPKAKSKAKTKSKTVGRGSTVTKKKVRSSK